jgi:AraC family transcriptional regulator
MGKAEMPDLTQIAQALDYIEDHLREAITVADIAEAVSYSLYHFCRTFNQATHHTPYDYLVRRRLSEAARALLETDRKIIDLALDYQFNNHETFSRAFKRVFDQQPSQWRKQGGAGQWHMTRWLMPRLTLAHLQQIARGPYLKPVVEERETFQVTGVMTRLPDKEPMGAAVADLWDLLTQELGRLGEAVSPGSYYGLVCYPEGQEHECCLYMAATEIRSSTSGEPPALANTILAVKLIPAMTCARFIHKGRRRDLPLTLDYVYHTWLPKSDRRLSLPWIVEDHGPDLPAADDGETEMAIYIPVEMTR